jgi:hypothetical protein
MSFRQHNVLAVQQGVQAVLGLGLQADHLAPLGNQGAQVADGLRRNPDADQ